MATPRAFSYIRFSTPEQQKGDSLRRQTEATEAWCQRNNVPLDTNLALRDPGKSAFRGAHRDDKAALGGFLRAINQGKVPKGSYLVLENLDRLSREESAPACHLLTSILVAGVKVVQLFPQELVLTAKSDAFDIMRAIMELSRGHGESAIKSVRTLKNWEGKRQDARNGNCVKMGLLPAWVEESDGKLLLIPRKAAAVQRIFELAAAGHGPGLIVKAMDREKFPPLGRSGKWSRQYVTMILKDRRALGEYQPKYRNGKPAGDVLPGYFPAVVSEAEWQATRLGTKRKRAARGRVGEFINIFAGLLQDARTHSAYYAGVRTTKGKHRRFLVSKDAMENGSKVYGFNFEIFERAILLKLQEIDPRDILGDQPGQNEAVELSIELENVRTQQDALAVKLALDPESRTLNKAAALQDAREKELTEQLDALRDKLAHPAGEAWGEAMSLAAALDAAPDPKEARLKLRGLLRQLVKEIWVLVVPLSRTRRIAYVDVVFESGPRRQYWIFTQDAGHCREGFWKVLSDLEYHEREEVDGELLDRTGEVKARTVRHYRYAYTPGNEPLDISKPDHADYMIGGTEGLPPSWADTVFRKAEKHPIP
jgi:DNA invertase Pin-like site-specific DNA recombinase